MFMKCNAILIQSVLRFF